jgi:hypothetical protein
MARLTLLTPPPLPIGDLNIACGCARRSIFERLARLPHRWGIEDDVCGLRGTRGLAVVLSPAQMTGLEHFFITVHCLFVRSHGCFDIRDPKGDVP